MDIEASVFRMIKSMSVGNNVEYYLSIVLPYGTPIIATQVADLYK
jgi:hypothetical protein